MSYRNLKNPRRRRGMPEPRADLIKLPPDDSVAVVRREDVSDRWLAKVTAYAQSHGIAPRQASPSPGPKFSHVIFQRIKT